MKQLHKNIFLINIYYIFSILILKMCLKIIYFFINYNNIINTICDFILGL